MKRALALAIGVVFVFACGSSDDSSGNYSIHPAAVYSGFDGDPINTFAVPATAIGVPDKTTVKWSVLDSDIADVATQDPATLAAGEPQQKATHHVIVTTKKDGTTKLRATIGTTKVDIPLTVRLFSQGAAALGDDLYQIDKPGASDPSQGGSADYVHGLGCIGCHGVKGGPGHSPSEIGGYDDATILKIIATAELPTGGLANNGNHKFQLDDKQQEAILARLRSLAPIDWPQ
jgi:mono/diheme cytochrome c family protein